MPHMWESYREEGLSVLSGWWVCLNCQSLVRVREGEPKSESLVHYDDGTNSGAYVTCEVMQVVNVHAS